MHPKLHYLFDPLCGWCYGARRALDTVAVSDSVDLRLLPSGLFQDEGARPMDDDFAAYAWSNDQRIEHLTGQPFSERYRERVLAARDQRFDSAAATLALTAVSLTAAASELAALEAIQSARYVDGDDVTRPDVLAGILYEGGLADAARMLQENTASLHAAARSRITEARMLMQRLGARGVPTFVLESDGQQRLVHASAAYSDPASFIARLSAA
jgi:putative protein-disulfide isomerase